MTGEEWERIKTIFPAAISVPQQKRNAYLNAVCGDQTDLFETVQELLQNHQDCRRRSRVAPGRAVCSGTAR
jgi:hypothetical protein